jgi:hypothetical protein
MPRSKVSYRKSKGDRRFKRNDGVLDPSRRNGGAHRGARGIAREGASGFVRCEGDLPGPEQHPEIQLRDEEAPLTEADRRNPDTSFPQRTTSHQGL